MNRKIKKTELIFICAILVVAAGLLAFQWLSYADAAYATILLDGEVIKTVPLSIDQIFSLEQDPNVYFEIRDGAAAFICNDCPDLVCVHRGFVSPGNPIPAACIPKGLLLSITAPTPDYLPAIDILVG